MHPNKIRPCVLKSIKTGVDSMDAFKKMRYAITYEMNRIGHSSDEIKAQLLEWNGINKGKISLGDGEAQRQLADFVDWFLNKECHMSCKTLSDYCLGINNCEFHLVKFNTFRDQFNGNPPHNINEVRSFLELYFHHDSEILMAIIVALKSLQIQNQVFEVYVGFNKLSKLITEQTRHKVDAMTVCRKIRFLESTQILQRTTHGKRGAFNGMANGYTFLPWKPPVYA